MTQPTSMIQKLSDARAFMLDGDGVLYRGSRPLPGAQEFIAALLETDTPFLLLTNNATKTPEMIADKLEKMAIPINPAHIFTSALATAGWLAARYPTSTRILPVGMVGLRTALNDAGYPLVDDHRQADLVVAALDFKVTFARLAEAALAIRRGCPFIGTNPDLSFPSERGIEPGAGAVLALIEAATGVSPTIIGKPQPGMFQQALAALGTTAGETVMVGDRYETDILGGQNAAMPTAAVLTGITSEAEFAAEANPPTWTFPGMVELLAAWRDE